MKATATKVTSQVLDLSLSDLVEDPRLQSRAGIHHATAEKYAALLASGTKLPPIHVAFIDANYYTTDGWHRVAATKRAGFATISAEVIGTTWDQAVEDALCANQTHGLPRTNADIRRVVAIALERWPARSDRSLAKICGVSDRTVNRARATLSHSGGKKLKIKRLRVGPKRPSPSLVEATPATITPLSSAKPLASGTTDVAIRPAPAAPEPVTPTPEASLHPSAILARSIVRSTLLHNPVAAPDIAKVLRELLGDIERHQRSINTSQPQNL